MTPRASRYPAELRALAIKTLAEVRDDYPSETKAIAAVSRDLGIRSPESLRQWVRQAEIDSGRGVGTSSRERAGAKVAARVLAEQRRAADIEAAVASTFTQGVRPPTAVLVCFIADNAGPRAGALPWTVEAICAVLCEHGAPIAPSTYYAARVATPSARDQRDEYLLARIAEVRAEHGPGYGARRVWAELSRRRVVVARCTVERLLPRLANSEH
ncbi:MAG: IS3 family transposase [Sporichthyaceae bacterium]